MQTHLVSSCPDPPSKGKVTYKIWKSFAQNSSIIIKDSISCDKSKNTWTIQQKEISYLLHRGLFITLTCLVTVAIIIHLQFPMMKNYDKNQQEKTKDYFHKDKKYLLNQDSCITIKVLKNKSLEASIILYCTFGLQKNTAWYLISNR